MILLWLSFLVLLLDRITKWAVATRMTEGESLPLLENIFHLTYVLNPGAAFGMFPHSRGFFWQWAVRLSSQFGGCAGRFWRNLFRSGRVQGFFLAVPWATCGIGRKPVWS